MLHLSARSSTPHTLICINFLLFVIVCRELDNPLFEQELKEEVVEACLEHGGAVHVFVDSKAPTGNVYIKCPSVSGAVAAVNSLHGRWFGGRLITAAYVPLLNYHSLLPDAMAAQTVLKPSRKS